MTSIINGQKHATFGGTITAADVTATDDLVVGDDATIADVLTLTAGGPVITGTNTDLVLLPNGTGITKIGDAGAITLGTPTNDDLGVSGRLQVLGASLIGGTLGVTGLVSADAGVRLGPNTTMYFLTSTGAIVPHNVSQTISCMSVNPGTTGNYVLMCEYGDRSYDFAHTQQTNPTLYIHSANQATDEWISLTHDQTDAVIKSGKGDIKLDDDVNVAGKLTLAGDLVVTRHFFNENFLWASGVYGVFWGLTNVNGAGTNVTKAGAGMGGVTILTTGAAGAGDYECTQTQDAYFSRVIQPSIDCHILLDTDLTGKEVFFGLSDNPMVEDGDYVIFKFDFSADNVNWWHSSSGGVDASLAVGPTAGTAQTLRLELDSAGQARFSVDHVLKATVAGAVANDHGDMYLFYGVQTEAAQAEIIEVDHIYAQWD